MMKKFFLIMACMAFVTIVWGQTSKKDKNNPNMTSLIETYWILQSVDGKPISGTFDITPYILFDKGNLYYGNTGCNSFFGKFTSKKNKLKMKYTGATKKICANMTTETILLKALKQEISNYRIEGDVLILLSKDREIMRCKAGENPNKGGKSDLENIEVATPTQNQDRSEKEEEKEVEDFRD